MIASTTEESVAQIHRWQPTHTACAVQLQCARKARNGTTRKRRGNSSSSGVGDGARASDSSGARGPYPGALQSAASVLLSFSAMTD